MIKKLWLTLDGILDKVASIVKDLLLLCIRLFWGWQFFITGKGHLGDVDGMVQHFIEWGIPMPKLNVYLAGTTEMVGGLFLLAGLCSRLTAIPLICTMIVAYATADHEALVGIFGNPDGFTGATPFLFLYASMIVFAFGPGRISLDELLHRTIGKR